MENIILHMLFVVLMMGMFMPSLLVQLINMLHGLFGFQRPYLLKKEDPLRDGYLTPRLERWICEVPNDREEEPKWKVGRIILPLILTSNHPGTI
jgi:hypothetical protein